MERPRRTSSAVWDVIGAIEHDKYVLLDLDTDITTLLTFSCYSQCNGDRELFVEPRNVFASAGRILFADSMDLHFARTISLLMLSEKPVIFEGFKFVERLCCGMGANGQHSTHQKYATGANWKTALIHIAVPGVVRSIPHREVVIYFVDESVHRRHADPELSTRLLVIYTSRLSSSRTPHARALTTQKGARIPRARGMQLPAFFPATFSDSP
jgi:hypothetical protein